MHPKPSAEMGRPGILGNEQYRMTGSLAASARSGHLYQRRPGHKLMRLFGMVSVPIEEALGGLPMHSDHTDVSGDKYKHLAEIYTNNHETRR
jgi:hypothetical protein